MTGAQQYWKAGWTGKGVDVAVIDSGVVPVPGLDGTDKLYHGPDVSFEAQQPELAHLDTYGHGTHMAGIIAVAAPTPPAAATPATAPTSSAWPPTPGS